MYMVLKTIKKGWKKKKKKKKVIWGNEYFKSKHKTLFFKHWIESGFVFVKYLFTKDGKWL